MKNLRKRITEFMSSKPNYDVTTYKHVKTIGYKFVTIIDLYSGEVEKISLLGFETIYIK